MKPSIKRVLQVQWDPKVDLNKADEKQLSKSEL